MTKILISGVFGGVLGILLVQANYSVRDAGFWLWITGLAILLTIHGKLN